MIFKVGDRVIEGKSRAGTVLRLGRDAVCVRFDDYHSYSSPTDCHWSGADRLQPLYSTPLEKMVNEYIRSEMQP